MSRRLRVAAASVSLSLLAMLLIAPTAGSAISLPLDVDDDPALVEALPALAVEIEQIEPLVLIEGDTAEITALVTNTTPETIEKVSVTLNAQGWTPNSRFTLLRWLDPERYDPALTLGQETFTNVAVGSSRRVKFEVPADDFQFNAWGPRGIEIIARADGVIVDRARSFVLWWNDPAVTPTSVGIIAPVAQTADELRVSQTDRVEDLMTFDGKPGLTLAVDPSVRPINANASVSLPWLNADADALLARSPGTYDEAVERSSNEAPGTLVTTWLDAPSTEALATDANFGDVILVPSDPVFGTRDLAFTPNALVESAPTPMVVIDTGLTEIMAGYAVDDGQIYSLNSIEQRQLFAAATSVITRERSFDGRTVFGSTGWDATTEDLALLDVLAEAPWVEPMLLGDVLTTEVSILALDLPASAAPPPGSITAEELDEIASTRASLADLSTLGPEVAARLDPSALSLDLLVSRSFRNEEASRTRILDRGSWLVDYYDHGVSVTGPSYVNMISSESEFPVIVTNTLPHPANVAVSLTPIDPRLQSPKAVAATIPAATTSRVMIPVNGVGWGDFQAIASIKTETGRSLANAYTIDVRLRANWEDWGLIAIVTIAVLALAVGIWRTIHRNRRIGRSEIIDAAAAELDVILEAERHHRRREP